MVNSLLLLRHGATKHYITTTDAGVALPAGWNHLRTDTFGTSGSVANHTQLHNLYNEGQYYNTDFQGLIVNNPINGQQQTYQHFETSVVFSTNHLTIQGRGQANSVIQSAQMVSKWSDRSFVYEAKFQTTNTAGAWLEYWAYSVIAGDASELDVEVVQTATGGPENTHQVFFANHGDTQSNVVISDSHFTTAFDEYLNASFDASTAPHYYTIFYDDATGTIKRYLDGVLIYTANWKWNQSLGGTGFGPDAVCIIDLAIGGSWPGNVSNFTTWTGDLDVYSIGYYTKRAIPVGQVWNQQHKSGSIQLSADYLTATKKLEDTHNATVYGRVSVSSGKYYWEVLPTGASAGAGIGTTSASVFADRYLGEDANTLGWFGNGQVDTSNAVAQTWATYPTTGARLCFALDLTNFKLWGRVGTSGNWCNDVLANQNPATNTGGFSLAAALQSGVCPAANLQGTTTPDSVVGVFSSASWAGTPPSGFGQLPSS
jgi:hypothetical protein